MPIAVAHRGTGCLVLFCSAASSGQIEGASSREILMHCTAELQQAILFERVYNSIMAMGFSAMFIFQLDNTER